MKKGKYMIDGVEAIIIDNKIKELGTNPSGIVLLDKKYNFIAFESYDGGISEPVEAVEKVKFVGDENWYSLEEALDQIDIGFAEEID